MTRLTPLTAPRRNVTWPVNTGDGFPDGQDLDRAYLTPKDAPKHGRRRNWLELFWAAAFSDHFRPKP